MICESDVCWLKIYHRITLFTLLDNGFLDYMTCLVYLIIVPDGSFVSESTVISITFLSFLNYVLFDQIALMNPYGQLITVLNGYVGQLMIISIFLILVHLVCLITELDESLNICLS